MEPDTKDWTWVLERACPECGFRAAELSVADVAAQVRSSAATWTTALAAPSAGERPRPGTWSTVEYACHVRDVHRVFGERLRLMLDVDAPRFADWDQDETAVASRYDLAAADVVGPELVAAAESVARAYDGVRDDQRSRTGHRSNGSDFTVTTLARYHLHDVVHHLWDVRRDVTIGAYQGAASDYRAATSELGEETDRSIGMVADLLGAGARVLEIGSGGGRDALALEARGLEVRRTDVTPGFVDLLRAGGHDAVVLDPLVDDLDDGSGTPYDGVWANASLLHVARADLGVVLGRLAAATRADGVLRLTLKEGDGDGWSTHGTVTAPRAFVYWREDPLREVLATAGWHVETVSTLDRRGTRWLEVVARRQA